VRCTGRVTRVFVSYAADADGITAMRLASDLRNAGVEVWMAPESIPDGEPFSPAIDRGLESSGYFVVLLSPASLVSRWVQMEVNAALDRALHGKIKVVPLVLSPVTVPPLLATFQQIEFADYDLGLSALGDVIGVPQLAGGATTQTVQREPPRSGRRPPPNAFVATVLGDLDRGAARIGYSVQRVASERESILESVAEVALLRVGVAVWNDAIVSDGEMRTALERELRTNVHRVAVVLGVHPGQSTLMTPFELLGARSPNAMVLTWNPADGADAVAAAIGLVVEEFSGLSGTRDGGDRA
jgi:TIR domain